MGDGRVRRIGRSALRLTAEQVTAGGRLVGALMMHILELHRGEFGYGQIRQIRWTKRGNEKNAFRSLQAVLGSKAKSRTIHFESDLGELPSHRSFKIKAFRSLLS